MNKKYITNTSVRLEVFTLMKIQVRSSGLWHCVVRWEDTSVLEGHAAFNLQIFRVWSWGSRGLWNTTILPHHYIVSQSRRIWFGWAPCFNSHGQPKLLLPN